MTRTEKTIKEILNMPISSYGVTNLYNALTGKNNRFSVEEAIEEFKERERAQQEVIVMGFDLEIFDNQNEMDELVRTLKTFYSKWDLSDM